MAKRLFSILLALLMALSCCPALAERATDGATATEWLFEPQLMNALDIPAAEWLANDAHKSLCAAVAICDLMLAENEAAYTLLFDCAASRGTAYFLYNEADGAFAILGVGESQEAFVVYPADSQQAILRLSEGGAGADAADACADALIADGSFTLFTRLDVTTTLSALLSLVEMLTGEG